MSTSTVESQLLTEPVKQLDLSRYCLVTADTPVREVIAQMREVRQNCALIVGKGTQIVGILTDRDVLKRVANHPETWDQAVEEVMTTKPDTVSPDATTGDALQMMDEGRYRNVPVVTARGAVRGNVTHYSILKFLTDHFPEVIYNLPPDPTNYAPDRDGG